MERQSFRIRSVGTKVTANEFELLKQRARTDGQTLSEWAREVLLREIQGEQPGFDLICEVVGLQLLLMNVLAPMARGERITAEQFQGIVKSVQTAKVKAAGEMLSRRHQPKEA
jgi:hypothetical protein